MSRLYDNIFDHEGELSKADMIRYLRDEMPDKERNRVERILEASPFEQEAMNGLQQHPEAWLTLNQLKTPSKFKSRSSFFNSGYFIGGIAATVIGILFVIFWPEPHQEQISELKQIPLKEDSFKHEFQSAKSKLKEQTEEITSPLSKNQDQRIIPKNTTTEAETNPVDKASLSETELSSNDNYQKRNSSNSLLSEAKNIHFSDSLADQQPLASFSKEIEESSYPATMEEEPITVENISRSKAGDIDLTTYVNIGASYYKVVNYNYESSTITEEKNEAKDRKQILEELAESTPPRYGNRFEYETDSLSANDQYSYFLQYDNILEKGIRAYHTKNYSLALQQFELILTTYPEDQNALFYSANTYIETRDFEHAISLLDKILNTSEPEVFNPEAEWIKAKALIDKDQVEQGYQLLEKIASENGFYSDQALQLMKKIKR